ncbi:MAG: AAA family ATPase, partial [Chloroflexi bacterium]|nr:AAA family ATPase [Chloroflexota bacterium]
MKRLERGAGGSVTVLAAPAGSGKTVLVRSWLEGRGETTRRAAWVAVERGERDPQAFWGAVISELRTAAPAGVTIGGPAPTPAFDADAVLRRLLSELASAAGLLVLVIDDVHEIAATEILEQLTYFLEHLPSTVHVVLVTRRDPQLGLHRRRLEGGLIEIRSADLQFTLAESQQMLSAFRITLSDASLRLLHERTEGWVAGLRLAAVALTSHPDPEQFVEEFSGSERTVAEYLLAEVLDSQPPDVRRLLVRTSLLDRVNGPLGDLLTGDSGTERHLQAMAEAGGFVLAVDAKRTWFRFHHLLADLLAAELRRTEPEEIPRIHHATARWYAENGHVIEAIRHAQAAGEHELAAGLLIEHYFSLMLDGRQATASSLLKSSALDSGSARPEIATVVANDQLAAGSLDQAIAYLALAERHAREVPEDRRHRFDMALLVTQLSLARRLGDFQSVAEVVQRSEAMVEANSSYEISMHNDVRALMLTNLGIVEVWSGRDAEGVRHLEEARALAERIGRPYLQVSAQAHRADAMTWDSFTRAREACRDVVALAERHGWGEDPVIGPALVAWAASLMQNGHLEEAEQILARADRTVRADLEPVLGFLLNMVHGGV